MGLGGPAKIISVINGFVSVHEFPANKVPLAYFDN